MSTRTVKDILNAITPTDTAQALGRIQFGSVMDFYFNPTIDAADRTGVASHIAHPVDSGGTAIHGLIHTVHATAGTSPGPKAIILTGSPSAGQVLLSYETTGQPKLTFNSTDAITGYRLHWTQFPTRSLNARSMRAEMASTAA